MKLKFNGILVLVVLMAQLTLRKRVVTGVVSDNAGMPIPGVSVLVKGTRNKHWFWQEICDKSNS
jgi:hypothetical protein